MAIRWRNTDRTYGVVAAGVHWLIAIAVVAMIALGSMMVDLPPGSADQFQLYQLHKSVGILVLLLTLARLVWRLVSPAPPMPDSCPTWQRRAAGVSHALLYILTLAVPLTGWAMISASVWGIPTVLFGVVPWPHLPLLPELPDKAAVEQAMKLVHAGLVWALAGLAVLHASAALGHHFHARDGVLLRMFGRTPAAAGMRPRAKGSP